MTHICVSKLTTIGSDNGLSPGRRQAIIWSNAEILLNWTLGTNFSEILSEIDTFSFKQMRLKMSSGKWRPYCLGLNVLSGCNYSSMPYIPHASHGTNIFITSHPRNKHNDIYKLIQAILFITISQKTLSRWWQCVSMNFTIHGRTFVNGIRLELRTS